MWTFSYEVRYIFLGRGPSPFFPSGNRPSQFSTLPISATTVLFTFTVMRVLLSFLALLAGAQALSSSLYAKRSGFDVCAYIDTSFALPNPHTGSLISFGQISKIIF